MTEYGRYRMADLYKEHNHQCETLEQLIEMFRNGPRYYKTEELVAIVEERIIKQGKEIYIDGSSKAMQCVNKYVNFCIE